MHTFGCCQHVYVLQTVGARGSALSSHEERFGYRRGRGRARAEGLHLALLVHRGAGRCLLAGLVSGGTRSREKGGRIFSWHLMMEARQSCRQDARRRAVARNGFLGFPAPARPFRSKSGRPNESIIAHVTCTYAPAGLTLAHPTACYMCVGLEPPLEQADRSAPA